MVVDKETLSVTNIITEFLRDGVTETFHMPYGVCVSPNEQLYIADRENMRIVVLELDGTFVKTIQDPTSDVLDEGFVFKPLKVTVDYADRVYCIAQNMFQGIMVFESDRIRFDEDILTASAQDMEVLVRCGSHIAEIK